MMHMVRGIDIASFKLITYDHSYSLTTANSKSCLEFLQML